MLAVPDTMFVFHKIMFIYCILLLCLMSRSTEAAVLEGHEIPIVHTEYYGELKCLDLKPMPYVKHDDPAQEFILYTRENLEKGQILKVNDNKSITNSSFHAINPTKFLIHGWYSESEVVRAWMLTMKNELLINSDSNVIVVYWHSNVDYIRAKKRTKQVGREVANFINYLGDLVGLDPQNVHLIGHSLGAHTAGHAGKCLHGLVGRITGLDPAGPLYQEASSTERLNHTDAQLVDVIHTDANIFGYGIRLACGHVDFYPNGGAKQPGCSPSRKGIRIVCDHLRALHLFTESINSNCSFVAKKCDSYKKYRKGKCYSRDGKDVNIMGLNVRKPSYPPGTKYFLTTGDAPPYCREQYEFTLNLAKPLGFALNDNSLISNPDSSPNGVETMDTSLVKSLPVD